MIPITAMQATTGYASNNTRSPNHACCQQPWMMAAFIGDDSKHERWQQKRSMSATTLDVDCIIIYQARILSLSFDIQREYDVSSRYDVFSKCSLPTGTCFSTGNSLVISIIIYKTF